MNRLYSVLPLIRGNRLCEESHEKARKIFRLAHFEARRKETPAAKVPIVLAGVIAVRLLSDPARRFLACLGFHM
jgi:hypothetical protein